MLRAFRLRPRRERFPVAPFPTGVSAPAPAGSCWVSFPPSAAELSPTSVPPVPRVNFREALLVQPPDARSREAVLGGQRAPRCARRALLGDLRGRHRV